MRSAYRLVVYLCTATLLFTTHLHTARAGSFRARFDLSAVLNARANTRSGPRPFVRPVSFAAADRGEIEWTLYDAVASRLGAPYRAGGTDRLGYDCSGFVWRVFQEAGIDFDRSSARDLWANLPPAKERAARRFGTLVFFRGLTHVGIVRDGYSFYHASSSQGVVRSYYSDNDGYWGSRVIGFRRVPLVEAEELIWEGGRARR